MSSPRSRELVDIGDLDGLTRYVHDLCDVRDWQELLQLREMCTAAIERGKQLWPITSYIEYRVALDGPAEFAAPLLDDASHRFTLGPLAEVVASGHKWDELAPYLPAGPQAAFCAHERVVRGEGLSFDRRIDPFVLDLPLELQPWEPAYPLAEYHAESAEFPRPLDPSMTLIDLSSRTPEVIDDEEACLALRELANTWLNESNGRAEAVAVRGDMRDAVAALGVRNAMRAPITSSHALALMAWTAASGGAQGRRKGMAAGRFAAWWTLAAVAGVLDSWPLESEELGESASSLSWWVWSAQEPTTGWYLRVAVEDPAERLAWAVNAYDAAL